ncbi:MAG: PAS domain S-box protein [Methanoregulaceae archaeon]|jgi:PAS domain S-box-containing protein|nr:PAS domain S-box protein [Methanoregulaceae archaeon]MCU0628605.1 PAS domain S-box protein [Methanoregulaceae archaeon]
MIRVLLVDRSNSQNVIQWCDTSEELSISLLPETTDLREALARYDIVILHVKWGDSAAIEIVRQIRTQNPLIPVIVLTDTLDAHLALQALTDGADSYLWDINGENYQRLLVPVIKKLVEHRKTEEQLVQDNLLMRAIHDASPVAACVIKGHQVLWVNAIIPRKLGYTESELIGSDPIRLFPDEAEHQRIDTGLYQASTEEGWGIVEGLLKRKDGTLINCHLLSRPIDPADPGKGQIVIGQDITDYVRIRDLLRKSEVRYQDLLDSANSIVLRVDPRGTIRFINNSGAAFFGFSPEELVGKNLVGTIVPRKSHSGRDLEGMIRDVMENPEEYEVNVNENMKRDGERVWIAWTNRAIRDESGRLTEMVSIGHDITDRKINHEDRSSGSTPWISKFLEGTDISEEVFEEVYTLSLELSKEGREGKQIGTTFMIGSAPEVLARSTQLILNPFEGHSRSARNVTNNEIRETVKELSQIDGAFVISGDGIIEAAGRYITIDTSRASIPKGLGTRHASVAGITQETPAVGIVLSQSGGKISLFKDGRIFRVITVKE